MLSLYTLALGVLVLTQFVGCNNFDFRNNLSSVTVGSLYAR